MVWFGLNRIDYMQVLMNYSMKRFSIKMFTNLVNVMKQNAKN